ncbi:MAG: 30S ribosomal protein THX [Desulfobacterales bacterium]|nr:30S ribosomal protein THX [Desulfobacterales bacterium]
MGKGDRRTKRGKIWQGTHGAHRPKAKKKAKSKNK